MVYVETPITTAIREGVEQAWALDLSGPGERLVGGEESASYRFGDHVVRVGSPERAAAELRWSYGVAGRVAVEVPEVTAPVATAGGEHVVWLDGRPVSVWPYAAGRWVDPGDEAQVDGAAQLLARLHRRFARTADGTIRPGQPDVPERAAVRPELVDPDLDEWLVRFHRRRTLRHPLHGDLYEANVLVRDGRIVALLGWDDVFVGASEQELAWAAAEFGRARRSLDLTTAMRFVDVYTAAGGTAERIGELELTQLLRARIRMEIDHAGGERRAEPLDPDDAEYEAELLRAFEAFRP